jgi:hypothetical protein
VLCAEESVMRKRKYALARFQADPSKVRVSLVKGALGWLAKVEARDGSWKVDKYDSVPEIAVKRALAKVRDRDGVDLYLEYTYRHPFRG